MSRLKTKLLKYTKRLSIITVLTVIFAVICNGIIIYNAEGKKMNYGRSKNGAHKLSISLSEEIQANWTIEILIESEQALKEHKFKIASVLLP